jgi:hypothetical protein
VLVLDMTEILPSLGKYKYDIWRILPVKCYIDNLVRGHTYKTSTSISGAIAGCQKGYNLDMVKGWSCILPS